VADVPRVKREIEEALRKKRRDGDPSD